MVLRYVGSRRRGAVGWMRRLVVVTSCLADACVRLWEEIASYNRSMCVSRRRRLVTSFSHATNGDCGSLLFVSWEAATIHLPCSCNIFFFLQSSKLYCCSDTNVVRKAQLSHVQLTCQFLQLEGYIMAPLYRDK